MARLLLALVAMLSLLAPMAQAAPGQWVRYAYKTGPWWDRVTREFAIYEPSWHRSGALPLVLSFHGGGGNGLTFTEASGLRTMAERDGAFIVALQALDGRWCYGGDQSDVASQSCQGETARDLAYVDVVMRTALRDFPVSDRRFLVGVSAGGMMAYRVACESAWQFGALAVVASTMQVPTCADPGTTAILHIHGDLDANVPLLGGAGPDTTRGVTYQPVQGGIDAFGGQLIVVPGGEHEWFVAPEFDATGVIAAFLRQH